MFIYVLTKQSKGQLYNNHKHKYSQTNETERNETKASHLDINKTKLKAQIFRSVSGYTRED